MKNSLSVLEIISGAKVVIVGVEGSGLEANGSDGGGLYMTGGEIGSSSDITMRCSSLSHQGNGSILSINSASVGQRNSLKSPILMKLAGTLKGDGGVNPVGYCSGYYKAQRASWRASGKKYEAQIVIFCILLAVNRFSRISWKVESR
jgi:hypothetical protein